MPDPFAAYLSKTGAQQVRKDPFEAHLKRSTKDVARQAVADMWLPVEKITEGYGKSVSAATEGLVGPAIRHGVNLVTGKESLGDVARDIPNAPRHLWEGLRATSPIARGQFTGPQNVSEELQSAGLPESAARWFGMLPEMTIGATALNKVGSSALLPAGRALANAERGPFRTRAVPGVKQLLAGAKPGSTLSNAMREEFYNTLRTREGGANWRGYLRDNSLGRHLGLPENIQDDITHAIETGTVEQLPKAQREVADLMVNEFIYTPEERAAVGGRRFALGEEAKVGYVPRYPVASRGTTKAFAEPTALNTNPGQMRSEAGRELTSREITGTGPRKFKPGIEAAMIHGRAADQKIMHLGIVGDLAKKFALPLKSGELPVSSIEGVPSGFTPEMQKFLRTHAFPKELHEVVTKLNQKFKPDEWNHFTHFVRTMNNEFRKWALFSTGTASRNLQNNLAQTFIAGNSDISTWVDAKNLAMKMRKGKLNAADLEVVQDAYKSGALGHGFQAIETGTPGTAEKLSRAYNFLPNKIRSFNSLIEDISRLSFYKHLKSKGMGSLEAGKEVDRILGNYSPKFQSAGFSKLRRSWWPFINWDVTIPQVFAKTALGRPGSVGMVGNIRSAIGAKGDQDKLPDYLRASGAVMTGPGRAYTPQAYGPYDIQQMTEAVGQDATKVSGLLGGGKIDFYGLNTLRVLTSKGFPQAQVGYAALSGRDPWTGFPLRTGPQWARFIEGKVPLLRIPRLMYDLKTNKPGAVDRLRSFLIGIREVSVKGK